MSKKITLQEVEQLQIEAPTKQVLKKELEILVDKLPDQFETTWLNISGMVKIRSFES